jgi:hypothetical protein
MTKALSSIAFLAAACLSAPAQWLHYPTPGIPRKPDGSPNLAAPAPRTADGKPDFSGLWDTERNRPCPPGGCADATISQEFLNFGWGLKGGLPYQPWSADLVKARMEQNGKDDPGSKCLPIGFLRFYTDASLRKIVQTPGLLVILTEHNTAFRQIYMDGRPLPVDPELTWNGYSTAKWDADALVIETNGFRDGLWLDRNGSPLSAGAKVVERLRRVNFGRIEAEVSVDDPKAYTKPWTVKLNLMLAPDSDLLDYTCLENEQDIGHLVGK